MPARPKPEATIATLVDRLDEEHLRDLLIDAAERHDDIARAVRLATASSEGLIAALRVGIDRGLRTRRFLDWREASSWANQAQPVVDALADAVEDDPTRELVALIERAIGHLIKVILRSDDSNGSIGDLIRQLLGFHELACDGGVADPVSLAKWMIRFNFDDQDFFFADPVRYATALGEAGLAAVRRDTDKRASSQSSSFAVRATLERLAVLDQDVDRIVELLGGELTNAYHFGRVAEAMEEIGKTDEALAWARRGIDETSGWQVGKLFDFTASLLEERGDHDGVLAIRREQHERAPSSSTYGLLQVAASAVGRWPVEVDAARAVLGERDRGGLVDVLLADGDDDTAWEVATSEPDWDAGDDRWLRLAKSRAPVDPEAALTIHLRLVDSTLETADRRNYRNAANLLKDARRIAKALGREADFAAHVASLREQHRRRPTLIAILDKAGLC